MCDFGKTVIYLFLLQVRELYVIYSLTQAVKNGVQSKEASDNQLCVLVKWASVVLFTFSSFLFTVENNIYQLNKPLGTIFCTKFC